jgi:hypothetical protein
MGIDENGFGTSPAWRESPSGKPGITVKGKALCITLQKAK